jgi:hypothetical protein
MSSVVVVFRAMVMLACLLAVPVLAMTQGEAVWRAKQAVKRFVHRVTAENTVEGVGQAGTAPHPQPTATPSSPIGHDPDPGPEPAEYLPVKYLPEPIEEASMEPLQPGPLASQPVPRKQETGPLDSEQPGPAPQAVNATAHWQQKALPLQHLGAVEYVLEKWGASGELYRFRCEVAVAGAESYRKHFEAVHSDGGRAVERVVEAVRSWRGSAEP